MPRDNDKDNRRPPGKRGPPSRGGGEGGRGKRASGGGFRKDGGGFKPREGRAGGGPRKERDGAPRGEGRSARPAGKSFGDKRSGGKSFGEKRSFGKGGGGFRKDGERAPRREFNREDRPKRDFRPGDDRAGSCAPRGLLAAMRRALRSARTGTGLNARTSSATATVRRVANSIARIVRSAISVPETIVPASRAASGLRAAMRRVLRSARTGTGLNARTSNATATVRRAVNSIARLVRSAISTPETNEVASGLLAALHRELRSARMGTGRHVPNSSAMAIVHRVAISTATIVRAATSHSAASRAVQGLTGTVRASPAIATNVRRTSGRGRLARAASMSRAPVTPGASIRRARKHLRFASAAMSPVRHLAGAANIANANPIAMSASASRSVPCRPRRKRPASASPR